MDIHSSQQYRTAVTHAQAAAAAYYTDGTVVMDDAAYDALIASIRAAEEQHPDWRDEASPTQIVGSAAAAGGVRHRVRMMSLDNVFTPDELQTWEEANCAALGQQVAWVVEPKLDGLAVSISYEQGRAVRVATRGDGDSGEDATHILGALVGAPARVPQPWSGDIRGEVVLTHAQLEAGNQIRLEHGAPVFANARNGAAGTLRAQGRDYVIPLTFFAYDAIGVTELEDLTHSQSLAQLSHAGFHVSTDVLAGVHAEGSIAERIAAIQAARAQLPVDIDGAVVKADDPSVRRRLGVTSRAPRWAIAYKYPADTVVSVLREVQWQVGRTGVITPRATIDPVAVGGVTVEHATLHNPDDLTRKGFMIGDHVTVYRAGDVVPRVEAPLVERRDGTQTPVLYPATCPDCGHRIDKSQARWRCSQGRACAASRWLAYACSRDALDIEGLGGKHLDTLVAAGLATTPADLFRLTADQLAGLDRLGQASAAKIMAQIDLARSAPLGRVITALGVRSTGRSLSRRLAAAFGSLEALADATVEQLRDVDGIGDEKALVITEELAELNLVIAELIGLGVTGAGTEVTSDQPRPLEGLTVCVTGTVPGMSRTEAAEAVERLGGKSTSSVSKSTHLLVAGDGAGSKLAKATSLGVQVMEAAQFAQLAAQPSAGVAIRLEGARTTAVGAPAR